MAEVRAAVLRANQRAIAHDHNERRVDLEGDGHGEVVAPAGDQRDFDAATSSLGNGRTVRFRQLPAAIEERTVDIECDEAHSHASLYREFTAVGVDWVLPRRKANRPKRLC